MVWGRACCTTPATTSTTTSSRWGHRLVRLAEAWLGSAGGRGGPGRRMGRRFFARPMPGAGKFEAAAEAFAGLDMQVHAHPMLGAMANSWSMDVVRDGPADAWGC